MTQELQDQGFNAGLRRITHLIRENVMHAHQKRRFKKTSDSYHAFPVAHNIIAQNNAATAIITDISYIYERRMTVSRCRHWPLYTSCRQLTSQIENELSHTSTRSTGKTLKILIIQILENWMQASPVVKVVKIMMALLPLTACKPLLNLFGYF